MLRLLGAFFSLSTLLLPVASAQPASVPPLVRLIVPFPAGGSTDVLARALAPQLAARLHTTVIVENRAGGSSLIGTSAVAKGPADGSMLVMTTNSLVTAVATMREVPFDVSKDLVPVAMVSEGPMVIAVNARSPIKSPADLVAAARSKPDGMTYGTSGIGTLLHLSTEWLNDAANIKTKHIPYKGAAPAAMDVASGTVDFMISARASIMPHVQSGRIRMIAVTSHEHSPAFPGLPPMVSAAPGFGVDLWAIVFAPAGTPANIVQLLNAEINDIAKTKELRSLMEVEGALPVALTPDQISARVRENVSTWRQVAKARNIVLE